MNYEPLIETYVAGPTRLREAIAGMSDDQLNAAPIPGRWSTHQVICHLADFEPVYADRMKRALTERLPTIFAGDPNLFATALAYERRNVEEELQLIESVRRHMARILRSVDPASFQRRVIHSIDGPITLATLLDRISGHIPHHIKFIEDKRAAIGTGVGGRP
jgi:hypothetical protein